MLQGIPVGYPDVQRLHGRHRSGRRKILCAASIGPAIQRHLVRRPDDAELQRIDLADTLLNARQLHAISRPLLPAVDSDELMATCALLIQFALTTGRFALAMPAPLKRQMLPDIQEDHASGAGRAVC